MPLGLFILNRIRFILTCDLTGAWADFGGVAAQFNHLAIVLGLTASDHAGIAVTYDFLMRHSIQKLAKGRSERTDYFGLLSTINRDLRADIVADFEAKTEAMKKEMEKEKTMECKGKKADAQEKKSGGQGGRWGGKKWTAADWKDRWAEWKNKAKADNSNEKEEETEKKKKKKRMSRSK